MGKNQITKHVKELAKLVQCSTEEIDAMAGHALRAIYITELIEAGLNACEVADGARHASLNAQKTYAQETQMRANTRVQALVQSNKRRIEEVEMKESSVEMPLAVEMPAKVVDNPYKRRIPFSQDPPSRPVGWSPGKWERYQRFEEFERIEKERKSEYAQQGAGSDNRGQFQSYQYPQQQAYIPPPPPQYIQVTPTPQYIQGPAPPQYQQQPWNVGYQVPPTTWNQPPPAPPSSNWPGNGYQQNNFGQSFGYPQPQQQQTIICHQPAPYPGPQPQQYHVPDGHHRPDPPPNRMI